MYFPRLRDLREDKDMNQTQIAKLFSQVKLFIHAMNGAFSLSP